jgi:hypothetical protein
MGKIILLEVAAAIREGRVKVERPPNSSPALAGEEFGRCGFIPPHLADIIRAVWKPAVMIALLLGAAAPVAATPPATADDALARQQAALRSTLGLDCDRSGGDIVVCGRQGPDPNRLPLPVPPVPGARQAGEPPAPGEALALGAEKCTTVGPNQQCGGGLPIIPIAIWLVRTAVKVAKGKD